MLDKLALELLDAQNECTLSWVTRDGSPAATVVSFVYSDGCIWMTALADTRVTSNDTQAVTGPYGISQRSIGYRNAGKWQAQLLTDANPVAIADFIKRHQLAHGDVITLCDHAQAVAGLYLVILIGRLGRIPL